jgi:diphosphomevalonate decarboxylase
MKTTSIAPSNIAFIKYWGKKDDELRLPTNSSISMNLSNLTTTTTVEFDKKYKKDEMTLNGKIPTLLQKKRVIKHLDRIRKLANLKDKAKVVSENNFPTATGLSSSASGFAALTVAATNAAGLKMSEKELSILARLGSGSACRSIPDGFTIWHEGYDNGTSYASSLFPSDYWNICDVIAVLDNKEKEIPTSQSQKFAFTSPFFKERLKNLDKKIREFKQCLKEKNFTKFGEIIENEALELHTIIITSTPSFIYLFPQTLSLIKSVRTWRKEGLEVYFTINTGHNVHIICQKNDVKKLQTKLKTIKEIKNVIINAPAYGARIIEKHLF